MKTIFTICAIVATLLIIGWAAVKLFMGSTNTSPALPPSLLNLEAF